VDSAEGLRELTSIATLPKADLRGYFPRETADTTNAGALDLLRQMLCFNPGDRISVQQALAHPYLQVCRVLLLLLLLLFSAILAEYKDLIQYAFTQAFHAHWSEPVCDRIFDFKFERSPSGTKKGGAALPDLEV
jgi:serine/threonine protein kinase